MRLTKLSIALLVILGLAAAARVTGVGSQSAQGDTKTQPQNAAIGQ